MNDNILNRVGEVKVNNFGSIMEIISYKTRKNIDIKFEDGYVARNRTYRSFSLGSVKNPYEKRLCGVGYIGEGKYNSLSYNHIRYYDVWNKMIQRCYDDKIQSKRPTYKECSVCKEWHNFQKFCEFVDDSYYEIPGEKMCLDKDILIKGNKVYSPDTCVFVPNSINMLFITSKKDRGKYPIGTYYNKINNKYVARCGYGKTTDNKYIGIYDTPEEAFYSYKNYKENLIKQIADKYKELIPQKLHDAMYKYEVEIDD